MTLKVDSLMTKVIVSAFETHRGRHLYIKEVILECFTKTLAQDISIHLNKEYKINTTVVYVDESATEVSYSVNINQKDMNTINNKLKPLSGKGFYEGEFAILVTRKAVCELVKKCFGKDVYYKYKNKMLKEQLETEKCNKNRIETFAFSIKTFYQQTFDEQIREISTLKEENQFLKQNLNFLETEKQKLLEDSVKQFLSV